VIINLTPELFVNNKYSVTGRNCEALFTIIDEEFAGHNQLGRINRITILVKRLNANDAQLCTTVIGLGDGIVAIRSDNPALRGKLLNKDNMTECTVEVADG